MLYSTVKKYVKCLIFLVLVVNDNSLILCIVLFFLFFFNQDSSDFIEKTDIIAEFPCAIALKQGENLAEIMVRFKQYSIIIPKADLLYCLTTILAIYYIFEINYPAKYLQAMGAFGWYVLEDKYYKLGMKASKIVSNLLKNHY